MLLPRSGYYLTLRNRDTGEVYARYKMGEGDRFSVTFIRSVNKSPRPATYENEYNPHYVVSRTRAAGRGLPARFCVSLRHCSAFS